jgi:hypothetical protein
MRAAELVTGCSHLAVVFGPTLAHEYAADPTSAMSLGPERTDIAAPPLMGNAANEEPTRQLSVAGASDHCVNCAAPLASDQRYCVNCGERRGKPRFSLAEQHEEPVQEVVTKRSSSSSPRRPRTSAGFNLIAGVATLLLAMGVGVLIGHNNSQGNSSAKQAAAPAITINGGGTANGATAASTGSGSLNAGSTSSGKKSKHGNSAKAAKSAAPSKVVVQKAQAAASKVTGGTAKTAGATAQQGSACSNGQAGCQNGKLTGNYFGQ